MSIDNPLKRDPTKVIKKISAGANYGSSAENFVGGKEVEKFEYVLQSLAKVSDGQQQLVGSLKNVTEMQSTTQADMVKHVESRLTEVQKMVSENLLGSATKTAHTLGELQQRLTTIDEAQNNIAKLSSSVLSLQDILSNKQARGAFGEIQLNDIVSKIIIF